MCGMQPDAEHSAILTPAALAALAVPGAAARWAAVQQLLHPPLAALAEQLRVAAAAALPRVWPLYDLTFASRRAVRRAGGRRDPIEEYHFVIDRPPRGVGIYLAVSSSEQRVIAAIQVTRARRTALRRAIEEGRALWQPLLARLNDVRAGGERLDTTDPAWIDAYLAQRNDTTLLAGFSHTFAAATAPDFVAQITTELIELLALCEAVMEQSTPAAPTVAILRERAELYNARTLSPVETLVARVQARGIALPESTIRAYHLALRTRPLAILTGVAGAGKTRLTRVYADAVYDIASGAENRYYLLIAVQPDWHNARDLLGYHNAITGHFHLSPLLRFMLRAAEEPQFPFYVCLDEMNIARPEYYFAPILSAMETDARQIDLGAPGEYVEATSGELLRDPFTMPPNIVFIGTVNLDESTHALSDKVLDRANVIDLSDIDLDAFRRGYTGAVDDAAWRTIRGVALILQGLGRPAGYRALGDVLRYLEEARGVLPAEEALDRQIVQRLIPKIRGEDSPKLRAALAELERLLRDGNLLQSTTRVQRIRERLAAEGFADGSMH